MQSGVEMIEAVLFDKDGTLFDFAGTWRGMVDRIIDDLAPDPAIADLLAKSGGYDRASGRFVPGSVIVAGAVGEVALAWAPHLPGHNVAALAAYIDTACLEAAKDPAMLAPASRDLPALLAALAERGLTLGVATNDSEAGAEQQLSAAGVLSAFSFVAGFDSVAKPKPAPDAILAFAEHAGVPAERVMMVGDSRHDLEAARAAGAGHTVGVLTGPAVADDLAALADHILPSIDHLPALLDRL